MPWWRHKMEKFSALLAICAGNLPVPGEFPAQRPVTRSFDVFFDLRLNKRLSKQWWGWWFEAISRPLWRHRNAENRPVFWHRHRQCASSSPPEQDGRLFADDIFRCIFVNENFCILIQISLKFIRKGPINNVQALVEIMAWCRIGDKPISERMLIQFTDAYTLHEGEI